MREEQTLNSRLRILVAKTFRAEQLYGSIRNSSQNGKGATFSAVLELANDIRAREWQRCYGELRSSLNEILSLGKTPLVLNRLVGLWKEFSERANEGEKLLASEVAGAQSAAERHEFTTLWKASAELVCLKSRVQAERAITEEIAGVLTACGQNVASDKVLSRPAASRIEQPAVEEAVAAATNIIPLRRRVG